MAGNLIIHHGAIFPRRPTRDRLSNPIPQLLFCLLCIQRSLEDWLLRDPEPGFWRHFEITCIQDTVNANDCQGCHALGRDCEMLPAGMEGHRFELLALISWVALFWGTYNTTEHNYEGLVENWFLPGSSLTQLAFGIADLCRAFTLLVRNHIDTHGLHPRCPNTRRVSYRNWLLSRMPIPQGIEADGSPERFAAMSLSYHKSTGTEDRVHLWYGAVRAFRSSVTRIARDGVSVPYHNDVATIIGRFPTSMIPTEGR